MVNRSEGGETISNEMLEVAYAEDAYFDAKRDAQVVYGEKNTVEEKAREATRRTRLAEQALENAHSLVEKAALTEHRLATIELLGLDNLTLEKGQKVTIEITDEVAAAYKGLLVAEADRKGKTGLYDKRFGFDEPDEYHDFKLSLEGTLIDNKPLLLPGVPFILYFEGVNQEVKFVAGEESSESPAQFIVEVERNRDNRLEWDLGIRIPIEGQENPIDHFRAAPIDFDIDAHIKHVLTSYQDFMDKPVHELAPLSAFTMVDTLGRYKKTKEVKKLTQHAVKALITTISGQSYHSFVNGSEVAPHYSVERYIELIQKLAEIDADALESAINTRASHAVKTMWVNRDTTHRRHENNFINITIDDSTFIRGELSYRRILEGKNPQPESADELIDAHADFIKRGTLASRREKERREAETLAQSGV